MTSKLVRQVLADIKRRIPFRPYAYPNPFYSNGNFLVQFNWGHRPADSIVSLNRVSPTTVSRARPWYIGWHTKVTKFDDTRIDEDYAEALAILTLKDIIHSQLPNKITDFHLLPFACKAGVAEAFYFLEDKLTDRFYDMLSKKDFAGAALELERTKAPGFLKGIRTEAAFRIASLKIAKDQEVQDE